MMNSFLMFVCRIFAGYSSSRHEPTKPSNREEPDAAPEAAAVPRLDQEASSASAAAKPADCFRRLADSTEESSRALMTGMAYIRSTEHFQELQVSPQDLCQQYTFSSLCDYMKANECMLWLSEHVMVACSDRSAHRMQLQACGNKAIRFYAMEASHEELTRAVTVVVQLLLVEDNNDTRKNGQVRFMSLLIGYPLPVSAPILTQLVETNEWVATLTLENVCLPAEHCQALGRVRPANADFELYVDWSSMENVDEFAKGLSQNTGPRQLRVILHMDADTNNTVPVVPILKSFATNTKLFRFEYCVPECCRLDPPLDEYGVEQVAESLARNTGLATLKLNGNVATDGGFSQLCQALSQHQTLTSTEFLECWDPIGMQYTLPFVTDVRVDAIVEMLRTNWMLEQIQADWFIMEEKESWRNNVPAMLERNVYSKRFAAVAKTRDVHYRKALMAKTMLHVKHNPKLVYLGLTGSLSPLLLEE